MITRAPRIPKKQQQLLLKAFALDITATQASTDKKKNREGIAQVSRMCATRYFRHYRELIYASLRRAPRFSGEVEVDIGFFSGRGSKHTSEQVRQLAGLPAAQIVAKRKAIATVQQRKIMVLGILQRGGDIYLHPIKSKSRVALEAVIRLVVERGATVYSDMEKGLQNLKLDGYTHHPINHSVEYVDKQGNHVNGIESFWREARRGMAKNFRGIPRTTIMLHIKEREWRYNNKDVAKKLKQLLLSSPGGPLSPRSRE